MKFNNPPISLMTKLPVPLHEALLAYLDCHGDWEQDRVLTAALSLFFSVVEESGRPLVAFRKSGETSLTVPCPQPKSLSLVEVSFLPQNELDR